MGAASPIVVVAGAAIGAGTARFAWSEVIEGGGNIYYGSIVDSQTLAFNPIRDTILFGNQDLYNMGKMPSLLRQVQSYPLESRQQQEP